MSTSVDELIPTRQSLLSRLKDWDDQEGWREFFNTYWRLIYGVALKAGLSEAEAQDVVQDTVIAVARRIREFNYDPAIGSFKNWLLVITRRRIADHQRKNCRDGEDSRPRRNQHRRDLGQRMGEKPPRCGHRTGPPADRSPPIPNLRLLRAQGM